MAREVFITGGLGFVGSHLTRRFLDQGYRVICFDIFDPKTTSPVTIKELEKNPRFEFIQGDIRNYKKLKSSLGLADFIVHLAAVSAVDRSIKDPSLTISTNVTGTFNVFEAARKEGINRIHYVSTDEVFGAARDESFNEESPWNPGNPYSAGKAGGEALALAWANTYGMHVTITNSANNFGPYQAPEKLIPRLAIRGLLGNTLPVYGDGSQIREWVFVEDHVSAIKLVCEKGVPGEWYCVGSGKTLRNIEIVQIIIDALGLEDSVIEYVKDRPGHDIRYALKTDKIRKLGWGPKDEIIDKIRCTTDWYKKRKDWWEHFIAEYGPLL